MSHKAYANDSTIRRKHSLHNRAAGGKPLLSNENAAVQLQFTEARGLLKQCFAFRGNQNMPKFVLNEKPFPISETRWWQNHALSLFCCIRTSICFSVNDETIDFDLYFQIVEQNVRIFRRQSLHQRSVKGELVILKVLERAVHVRNF